MNKLLASYVIDFGADRYFIRETLGPPVTLAKQEAFRTIVPRYPNDIVIYDENDTMVAKLPWIGPSFDDYGDWLDYVSKSKGYKHCYGERIFF